MIWLAVLVVVVWVVLSLSITVVSLLFDGDPTASPSRTRLLRAWLVVAARMALLPFVLPVRAVQRRGKV